MRLVMMIRRLIPLCLLLAALGAVPAGAGIPVPWVPANAGVLWYQPNDPVWPFSLPRQPPGEATGAWYLTRRIAVHPTLPGVMHLGSFMNGLYASVGGGGWVALSPPCLLPLQPPGFLADQQEAYRYARRVATAASGIHGCAIEGIAYDPIIPNRMYVAAYDVLELKGSEPTLGDAGVYRSDDLGVTWVRLAGGFRGNGLAVATNGLSRTIVVGYIQSSNGSVGATPDGGSLMVSRDDGASWRTVSLPNSGCADAPNTSQRITPTITVNPVNSLQIFAGTNAGLYVSQDAGQTWSIARLACAGVWGVAITKDGSTLYIGDKDGVISKASTSTLAFTPMVDLGSGKVQSLLLDSSDERTLYAAMWSGSDASVFSISTVGGVTQRLEDSLLREILPVDQAWPVGVPKPFPISFRSASGQAAPSLFLAQKTLAGEPVTSPLWVSTILRGVFVRGD